MYYHIVWEVDGTIVTEIVPFYVVRTSALIPTWTAALWEKAIPPLLFPSHFWVVTSSESGYHVVEYIMSAVSRAGGGEM